MDMSAKAAGSREYLSDRTVRMLLFAPMVLGWLAGAWTLHHRLLDHPWLVSYCRLMIRAIPSIAAWAYVSPKPQMAVLVQSIVWPAALPFLLNVLRSLWRARDRLSYVTVMQSMAPADRILVTLGCGGLFTSLLTDLGLIHWLGFVQATHLPGPGASANSIAYNLTARVLTGNVLVGPFVFGSIAVGVLPMYAAIVAVAGATLWDLGRRVAQIMQHRV